MSGTAAAVSPPGRRRPARPRRRPARPGAARFAGLQAYHGRGAAPAQRREQRRRRSHRSRGRGCDTRELIECEGIAVRHSSPAPAPARSGRRRRAACSASCRRARSCSWTRDYARTSATPLGTAVRARAVRERPEVISSRPAHAVCDAGHKSHAIDSGLPSRMRSGPQRLAWANGGDEHGILRAARGRALRAARARAGRLWLIPGHCDPTVNLHDTSCRRPRRACERQGGADRSGVADRGARRLS